MEQKILKYPVKSVSGRFKDSSSTGLHLNNLEKIGPEIIEPKF